MTVRTTVQGAIVLEGTCPSEDAEILLQNLVATPGAQVDLRTCEFAHTAVIQVLMAANARLIGPPADPALRDWVCPILGLSGV
jgi:hypothetical protein